MSLNAAGLIVDGEHNPNWKGGLLSKECLICGTLYRTKRVNKASNYCSMQCVGVSQRGKNKKSRRICKTCSICGRTFSIAPSHQNRQHCCSKACSYVRRAAMTRGDRNPNWTGGLSRMPYPWNFREISKAIIARDDERCRNPGCDGRDARLTAHHINYDKQDCRNSNLITLCSACNSKANFGRDAWELFYSNLMIEVFE